MKIVLTKEDVGRLVIESLIEKGVLSGADWEAAFESYSDNDFMSITKAKKDPEEGDK